MCFTFKTFETRNQQNTHHEPLDMSSKAPAAAPGGAQPQGTQELTAFVQNLLQQMQTRFQEMSDAIITRIDEMGARIDDLEKSIAELMQQAGVEEGDTPGAQPTKA
jgi:heat shock factor-binding protein 1